MADLRRGLTGYTVRSVEIGLLKWLGRYLVDSTPLHYVKESLGRYGYMVVDVVLGFALDFVDARVEFLERWRIPSGMFMAGIIDGMEEALNMVQGRGFAVVTSGGQVKLSDTADTVVSVFKEVDGVVKPAQPGSVVRTHWFRPVRYILVGQKHVYYTESPYELADLERGG